MQNVWQMYAMVHVVRCARGLLRQQTPVLMELAISCTGLNRHIQKDECLCTWKIVEVSKLRI